MTQSSESFIATYPSYDSTCRLDELRTSEYTYLDNGGHIYLDYTGAGLAAISQYRAHTKRLVSGCFGNPHTESPTAFASTELVERTRSAVLRFFNASPEEYVAIFTPNASGACRLVAEAFPWSHRRRFVLTADNHNSVNGIREFARRSGSRTTYVPVRFPDLRGDSATVQNCLRRVNCRARGLLPYPRRPEPGARGLFAYPAQSNFSGVRHPFSWVPLAHEAGFAVLLDAAAFVPTNRLDLSLVHPDFVTVSWYKVFGYPTGIGCLVARRSALRMLRRPWFAGGTVRAVSVAGDWHAMADDESAFEDGTLNFLSIPDLEVGLSWIQDIGIDLVHERVRCLTGYLLAGLQSLRHTNGRPMAFVYGPLDTTDRGGTIAFNLLDPDGVVVDERLVARESSAASISLRTGCFCNPGASETGFELSRETMSGEIGQGVRTLDEYIRLAGLSTAGALRVSLGLVSNISDVRRFLAFLAETYRDRPNTVEGFAPRLRC